MQCDKIRASVPPAFDMPVIKIKIVQKGPLRQRPFIHFPLPFSGQIQTAFCHVQTMLVSAYVSMLDKSSHMLHRFIPKNRTQEPFDIDSAFAAFSSNVILIFIPPGILRSFLFVSREICSLFPSSYFRSKTRFFAGICRKSTKINFEGAFPKP